MIFFRIFEHLLPHAKAWKLTVDKNLRRFFEGLAEGVGPDARNFLDLIWLDIFPQYTRQLSEWENQFGLTAGTLTESERRARLDGAWKALGGQSPRYIQDVLQAAGFDVYVHEWFAPGSTYPPTPRNPHTYLSAGTTTGMEAGEAIAECGEVLAMCGYMITSSGSVLTNNTLDPGEPAPVIPSDPAYYPFFIYIGAAVFPNLANVPADRRDEFETLILKVRPAQQWIGLLINYV